MKWSVWKKGHNDEMSNVNAMQTDYIYLKDADTLAGVFLERVTKSPHKTAYVYYQPEQERWQEISWSQMGQRVAHWQAAFLQESLKPGDRVAMIVNNGIDWVTFELAAQGLGLVTVPLYTNDRAENIGYILQDAGVRLLLVENKSQWLELQKIRNQLAGLNRIITLEHVNPMGLQPRLVYVDEWLPDQAPAEPAAPPVLESGSLATIVYTSGTTGRAKGVMLSHRNILWDIESGLKIIDIYPSDHFLSFLPLSHTLERTVGFYLPLVAGSSVAFCRSVPQLAEDLQLQRPTIIVSVPRIFERVYAKIQEKLQRDSPIARFLFNGAVAAGWQHFERTQGRAPWSPMLLMRPFLDRLVGHKVRSRLGGRLRIAVSGGAPLSPEIARMFLSLGVPILQGYGLTETSPIISANTHEDNLPASAGIPLPGIEIQVSESEELSVRAPSVMLGYWNDPKATAEILDASGWLRTGDKVRIEQGHIFITGRLKEIIVMANGEKVPPTDMEMCIATDSLFEHVLILGEQKPYLSALVVLNAEIAEAAGIDPMNIGEADKQRLLERINDRLDNFPGFAKVVRIAVSKQPWSVENGFITPTLKLKRHAIVKHHQAELEQLYAGH